MIAVAYDQKERTVPTSRNNQSLEIVIWMYDNHRDGVIALRRWRADQTLKTNGVTRAAFAAARAHFGENQLLDLANIGRIVEERVNLETLELDRTPYAV